MCNHNIVCEEELSCKRWNEIQQAAGSNARRVVLALERQSHQCVLSGKMPVTFEAGHVSFLTRCGHLLEHGKNTEALATCLDKLLDERFRYRQCRRLPRDCVNAAAFRDAVLKASSLSMDLSDAECNALAEFFQ